MPDNARSRVAVLMPTYNRRATLGMAMASVIKQEFADWVLWVVNDGGEDVADIVAAAGDPRVRHINAGRLGKSGAMNTAIGESESEYIAYLDDDDAYYPNHLNELVSALDANPALDWACSRTVAESWMRSEPGSPYKCVGRNILCDGRFTPEKMRFSNQIPNLNVVHRRSLLEKAGLYDTSLPILIDWDMYRRFSYFADCHSLPAVTGVYRRFEDKGHIGDLQHSRPEIMPIVKNYIRAKIPRVTSVFDFQNVNASAPSEVARRDRLSVLLLDSNDGAGCCFDEVSQILAEDCHSGNGPELLATKGVLERTRPDFAIKPLPVANDAPAAEIYRAAIEEASGGRFVALRADMRPALGWAAAHAAGRDRLLLGPLSIARAGWSGAAAELVAPDSEPALLAFGSRNPLDRSFYGVWNEFAVFNLSAPVASLRAAGTSFKSWNSPVWFQPWLELLASSHEGRRFFDPDIKVSCIFTDNVWLPTERMRRWGRALAGLWGSGPRLEQSRAIAERYASQKQFLANVNYMLARLQQAQEAGKDARVFAAETGINMNDISVIISELVRSSREYALLVGVAEAS